MGEASGKLLKLRLVAFRYKNDPAENDAYRLVAEVQGLSGWCAI